MTEAMIKITGKNKNIIQFCFSNPHVIKARQEIQGITHNDIQFLGDKLKQVYGDNWFSFFLALKPATLNSAIGVA